MKNAVAANGLGLAALVWLAAAGALVAQPVAPVAAGAEARGEFESLCREMVQSSNPYYGTAQIARLRSEIAAASGEAARTVPLMKELGLHELRLGREEESIRVFSEALQLAARERQPVWDQIQLLSQLGLAYLRLGEVTNCVENHTAEMCIFPISSGGRHQSKEPVLRAMQAFEGVLEGSPDFLPVQWLLNIAAMTAGRFPDGVPADVRIPQERLVSEQDVGRFPDVASDAGLHIFDTAGGAIVDDFDGDGLLDVMTSGSEPCSPLRYFGNGGNGSFVDRAHDAGLDGQLGGLNLVPADYNNDGHLDLLVLRGAWLGHEGRMRNSLLRNQGDGTFVDVTARVGLAEPAAPTQTAAWADYDLDGDLDLYVGNETAFSGAPPSQLFRNDLADGIEGFTDVASDAGVTNDRLAKGVAWGDYDNDGDPDLYVSNLAPNRLYRNDGDGRFTDVAPELGLVEPAERSFATWFFDFDNDGDLDLFVGDYSASIADVARHYLGVPPPPRHPRLYRNQGDGTFQDASLEVGLTAPSLPMGANFGDLDNDGFLDFYLGTGTPQYEALMPNLMYRNDAGRRFVDVTFSGGFGHLQKGHGVAFADLDHDGDQDVFEQMGGAYPGDPYMSTLYENPGHGNGWLKLELVGRRSNRAAYGARVAVHLDTPDGPRSIHRAQGSVASFGGSPRRLEIGLGPAPRIGRLEVVWPASGTEQVFRDVDPDRLYVLVEGGELEPRDLQRLRLGDRHSAP